MGNGQENVHRNLVLSIVLVAFVAGGSLEGVRGDNAGLNPNSVHPCLKRDSLMDPTHEVRFERDVVWQIPPNPKAVFLFAHGTDSDVFRYFDYGPNCKDCYGFPEERTMVLEALKRSYAVIAVDSLGIRFDMIDDFEPVNNILKSWVQEHSPLLEGLAFVALGFSSGGFFVPRLAVTLPNLRALVLMCSEGDFSPVEVVNPSHFPPVFFAYMPRDKLTLDVSSRVLQTISILTEKGVLVEKHECLPKPLSPSFFTERILCISSEMSTKIFSAYKEEGWLDSNDYLIRNPRLDEDWEAVMWKRKALPFCPASGTLCLEGHVREEINVAYADHVFTSDAKQEIFTWLESTLSPVQPGVNSAVGFVHSQ